MSKEILAVSTSTDKNDGQSNSADIAEARNLVRLKILFSRHCTASDFQKLSELLPHADVYCPELVGWTEENARNYQQVANGHLSPSDVAVIEYSDARKHAAGLFHGTKIKILMTDIPEHHALHRAYQIDCYTDNTRVACGYYISGDFDTAFEMYKRCAAKEAIGHKSRERYIKGSFKELRRIASASRKSIQAVANLGLGHADMDLELGDEFVVERIFEGNPDFRPFNIELIRKLANNESCSDELFAKAMFEDIFNPAFLKEISQEGYKIYVVGRHLVDKLSFEKIREISAFLCTINSPYSNLKGHKEYTEPLRKKLAEYGLVIPTNSDEFERLYESLPK